jgi:outer membrane protein OmpA-like peptidoglycan-associated protein
MNRNIIFSLMLLISFGTFAQEHSGRYSISGGFLGAVNFAHFKVGGNNPLGLKYGTKTSFGGGIWINFPICKAVSLETQGIFQTYRYEPDFMFANEFNGSMDYASIPVFLKFHAADVLAFTAGVQFDFLTSARDVNHFTNKDAYMKSSTSLTGGVELFPRGRFVFFGRYIHGLTDMENRGNSTNPTLYNRNFQVGLKLKLFGGYTAPPVVAVPLPVVAAPVDTDGDGIFDPEDKCPNQAGVAKYAGCPVPDTDGDGINDEADKCPAQAGLAKYGGCPIPDTDGDGINDEEDKCPSQSGMARYGGCPVPDTDGDGINDEEDGCPKVAGPASNKGCPIIGIDAYKVVFKSGSSVLLPAGKVELDKAVTYLKSHEGFDVMIEGHTDNSGSDKINLPLSKKRAESVKAYFVKNGIPAERLYTEGFGSSVPIEDNKTPQGRKLNRRIEVKLKQ